MVSHSGWFIIVFATLIIDDYIIFHLCLCNNMFLVKLIKTKFSG
jgi:hypothetical protein